MSLAMSDLNFTRQPKRLDLSLSLTRVESLGVNCELGLIQRHCSVENIGLFRFGRTPIDGLISAVENNFDGIGDPEDISLRVAYSKEWLSTSRRYGFEFHTEHMAPAFDEAQVRARMSVHFKFLARKLREELEDGEKLFFYRPEHACEAGEQGERLANTVHQIGSSALVWVSISEDPAKVGTVEWTIPGSLMTAYLDRYGAINYAIHASYDVWLQLVVRALEMFDVGSGHHSTPST